MCDDGPPQSSRLLQLPWGPISSVLMRFTGRQQGQGGDFYRAAASCKHLLHVALSLKNVSLRLNVSKADLAWYVMVHGEGRHGSGC